MKLNNISYSNHINILFDDGDTYNNSINYFKCFENSSDKIDNWIDNINDVNENYENIFLPFLSNIKPTYIIWRNLYYIKYMKTITEVINERLSESIKITNKIKEKIEKIPGVLKCNVLETGYKIIVTIDETLNDLEFLTLMNFLGYTQDKNEYSNQLTFEAYHPKEVNYKEKYIYHVTPAQKYKSILNKGLVPKQKPEHHRNWLMQDKIGLEYPERLYVFKENVNKNTISSFFSFKNRINGTNETPVLLKIDVEAIRHHGRDLSFFSDPAFISNNDIAMFTMEPIPSKFIVDVEFI